MNPLIRPRKQQTQPSEKRVTPSTPQLKSPLVPQMSRSLARDDMLWVKFFHNLVQRSKTWNVRFGAPFDKTKALPLQGAIERGRISH